MIAIETRRMPATNTKPARYVATTNNGQRITMSADALPDDYPHAAIARALCAKMDWLEGRRFDLAGGGTREGMAFVFVERDNTRDFLLASLAECITVDGAHCFQHQETPVAMARRLRAINETARAAITRCAA